MQYTILIAEDDTDIVKLVKLYLESSGYKVLTACNGEDAFRIAQDHKIDLAILDIMMPKMDGFELTQKIRQIANFPIIILSAKSEDADKILGLNLGADDYITKPFAPLEIVARVQANIRRFYHMNGDQSATIPEIITVGELTLDMQKLTLRKNDKEIVITSSEFKILTLFMRNPGRVFNKSQICEAINGEFYENYENVVAVHISHIRDKIEDDPKNPIYIKNIRGLGYKIEKQ